jgi:hypothetical protein
MMVTTGGRKDRSLDVGGDDLVDALGRVLLLADGLEAELAGDELDLVEVQALVDGDHQAEVLKAKATICVAGTLQGHLGDRDARDRDELVDAAHATCRAFLDRFAATASWSAPRLPFLPRRGPLLGVDAGPDADPPGPPGPPGRPVLRPPARPPPGAAEATGRGMPPMVAGRGRGAPGAKGRGRGRSGNERPLGPAGRLGAGGGVTGASATTGATGAAGAAGGGGDRLLGRRRRGSGAGGLGRGALLLSGGSGPGGRLAGAGLRSGPLGGFAGGLGGGLAFGRLAGGGLGGLDLGGLLGHGLRLGLIGGLLGLDIGAAAAADGRLGLVAGGLGLRDGGRLGLGGAATALGRGVRCGLVRAGTLLALPAGPRTRDLVIGQRAHVVPHGDVDRAEQRGDLIVGDPEFDRQVVHSKLTHHCPPGPPAPQRPPPCAYRSPTPCPPPPPPPSGHDPARPRGRRPTVLRGP